MTIGYEISGYDNDGNMTGSTDKLFDYLHDIPKCTKCGYRTDYRYVNREFKFPRRRYDFSYTYDNIAIVSLKFKEFCTRNKYANTVFVDLPRVPNFFAFYVNDNQIPYDGTKEKYCDQCGQFESVVAPIPLLNNLTEPLKDGFYQSNLWFSSGNSKSPIIIISPETKAKLDQEQDKFKGIVYTKLEK